MISNGNIDMTIITAKQSAMQEDASLKPPNGNPERMPVEDTNQEKERHLNTLVRASHKTKRSSVSLINS